MTKEHFGHVKREKIKEYDGRVALVNDSHYGDDEYTLARLRFDSKDDSCYYLQLPRQDGILNEIRVHYHDLEGLLVPGNGVAFHSDFKTSKMPFS